jgi:hypothetical protein
MAEGKHEQNECRKTSITNFTLSAKWAKINSMSSEELGGKYPTLTGHLA